jgi:Flp pilus assembly protein TadG
MLRLLGFHRRPASRPEHQRGQALPLFALMIFVLTGSVAIVTDVSWFWVNQQRMQRAADAASLAGAVFLPGDVAGAYAAARASAKQNGYSDGVGGVVITPVQEHPNTRRLDVTVSGPVGTYFARVFGMNSVNVSARSKAEFTLPVPMGSPQNYYGIGYYIGSTTTVTPNPTTWVSTTGPLKVPGGATLVAGTGWTPLSGTVLTAIQASANPYISTTVSGRQHDFDTFGLSIPTAVDSDHPVQLLGLEVLLNGAQLGSNCTGGNKAQIAAQVSWDNGTTWSAKVTSPDVSTTAADLILGAANSTSFGGHDFLTTPGQLADGKFKVRITAATCTTKELRLNQLQVRVTYRTGTITYSSTTSLVQDAPVPGPHGETLAPQKFWGSMQSQGAPSVQGDAYMTKYNLRTTSLNDGTPGLDPDTIYDPVNYYNYGVDVTTNGGEVWIFDPGFCDTTTTAGVGENWTVGGTNGYSTQQPVSSYFDLLNTQGTPYDYTDDTIAASSGNTFARLHGQDKVLTGAAGGSVSSSLDDCTNATWHNKWWRLASGLPAGKYRLHTYSTDFSSLNDQNNTTALNAFAFWASPGARIYGLGAMEAYARLPKDQVSEFYLAQIDAIHAGKTMAIELWDPGDTGNILATLQILAPTGTGFTPATFSYVGEKASDSGLTSCDSAQGVNVTSVVTANGSSLFNGCWLSITVQLPLNYSAPIDPVSGERGWWKIRYTMSGGTSATATDLTTWQVSIRGNPVHLVR